MAQVGVVLPSRERALAGDWSAAPLVELARQAEGMGFDSVWVGDSLTARPRLEPVTLLAAVAAATERVTLGTAALTATLRDPILSAHALATLDQLADGRLVLGLGAAFPYPESEAEFRAVGVPFSERYTRLAETVDRWRTLWRGEAVPGFVTPTKPDGPPLWFAGAGAQGLDLAGRLFDGWMPYVPSPEELAARRGVLEASVVRHGRSHTSMTTALYVTVLVDDDAERAEGALDAYAQAYYGVSLEMLTALQAFVWGPAEHCVARLRAFADVGVSHFVVRIGSLTPQQHLEAVADALLHVL